ncbi:hypothetical protein BCY89_17355 [Sphingobacterium siyangense]|uniref:Uncharacterized protein n=1 Tax=Sphingobacterium siyangense TaxID=459529 RepID=A0A420FGD2_9SPHI|nr:hypothetical protein BV902_13200 [Sphingobacterium sp. B29]RKF31916.1 hypothetical protein BCY89_17355 [Sphingobacterium siyangense]
MELPTKTMGSATSVSISIFILSLSTCNHPGQVIPVAPLRAFLIPFAGQRDKDENCLLNKK